LQPPDEFSACICGRGSGQNRCWRLQCRAPPDLYLDLRDRFAGEEKRSGREGREDGEKEREREERK